MHASACGGYKYQFRQNPHAFNLMDPIVLVTNLGILIAVLKVGRATTHRVASVALATP